MAGAEAASVGPVIELRRWLAAAAVNAGLADSKPPKERDQRLRTAVQWLPRRFGDPLAFLQQAHAVAPPVSDGAAEAERQQERPEERGQPRGLSAAAAVGAEPVAQPTDGDSAAAIHASTHETGA